MKEELVILKQDDVFTTSKVIAEGCNVKHHAIQVLVDKYQNDFKEFGKVSLATTTT